MRSLLGRLKRSLGHEPNKRWPTVNTRMRVWSAAVVFDVEPSRHDHMVAETQTARKLRHSACGICSRLWKRGSVQPRLFANVWQLSCS
jgi:prephenate dehydrogenase